MNDGPTPRKIVALLFRRVGDSLMATPALRAVKLCFPHVHLSVICEPHVARVFEGNSALSELIVIRSSPSIPRLVKTLRFQGRPDIVLDFLSNPRTAMAVALSGAPRRVGFAYPGRRWAYSDAMALQNPTSPIYSVEHKLRLAKVLGCNSTGLHTEFYLSESNLQFAASEWHLRGWQEGHRIVAFFIHSRRTYKRWPLEYFAEVVRELQHDAKAIPLILSTPGDEDAVASLQQLCALSTSSILRTENLGQLGAVLKRCALLVGNDGGPKHLAIALDVPTLTIFGKEPPEYWTPPNDSRHKTLSAIQSNAAWPTSAEVLEALRYLPLVTDK